MSLTRKVFRHSLSVATVILFLYQFHQSVLKLQDGHLAITATSREVDRWPFPDVALCQTREYDKIKDNDLFRVYETFPGAVREAYIHGKKGELGIEE